VCERQKSSRRSNYPGVQYQQEHGNKPHVHAPERENALHRKGNCHKDNLHVRLYVLPRDTKLGRRTTHYPLTKACSENLPITQTIGGSIASKGSGKHNESVIHRNIQQSSPNWTLLPARPEECAVNKPRSQQCVHPTKRWSLHAGKACWSR
jgi:hypothetical protein